MSDKTIKVKLIKAFEIKPNTKYLVILPSYLAEDRNLAAALTKLFQDVKSDFVGLMMIDPDKAKIIEVPQKEAK